MIAGKNFYKINVEKITNFAKRSTKKSQISANYRQKICEFRQTIDEKTANFDKRSQKKNRVFRYKLSREKNRNFHIKLQQSVAGKYHEFRQITVEVKVTSIKCILKYRKKYVLKYHFEPVLPLILLFPSKPFDEFRDFFLEIILQKSLFYIAAECRN